MEIRKFDYANESRMSGALQALRQKIPQLELAEGVKDIILKDLGGIAHFRRCAQVLEICVGFLAATGNPSSYTTIDCITITCYYFRRNPCKTTRRNVAVGIR